MCIRDSVMNAAIECEVKKVVLLSTDKAVYPINAMGMTKGLMEKLMTAKIRNKGSSSTIFCATRYGNVMASRGSVIPLFVNLIQANKPLTITDPGMTRFLMTLDESVELVMHAFEEGQNGDILVQKSPASTIETLASALLADEVHDINVVKVFTSHIPNNKLNEAIKNLTFSPVSDFDRSITTGHNDYAYHHIGIYGFTREALIKYVNLKRSKLELERNLEQMRVLDNNMKIHVGLANSLPLSVDTEKDLQEIKKNMEKQ